MVAPAAPFASAFSSALALAERFLSRDAGLWSQRANVQLASLSMILFDPLNKVLMAKFGGSTSAGYFEMANQVVVKGRALIVSANKAIVPKVEQLTKFLPQRLTTIYYENK